MGEVLVAVSGGEGGILLLAAAVGLSRIFLAYFCWSLSASSATTYTPIRPGRRNRGAAIP
jgi:hypothetical protein